MNTRELTSNDVINQISLLNKLVTLKIHEKDDSFIYCISDLIELSLKSLFEIDGQTGSLPYFHSLKERKHVFRVLLNFCSMDDEFSLQVVKKLSSYYESEEKDYLYYQIGNLNQNKKQIGIRNMGNTCYLNSIIQQLFHIQPFRYQVMNTKLDGDSASGASIYNHLRNLFAEMELTIFDFVNTKNFCFNFTAFDGNPINSDFQQDANEFFSLLLDSVENALKSIDNNFVKHYFTGVLENQISSIEPEYPFERVINEPFINICLDIRNKKHLASALDSYTKSYTLDDDNKIYCEDYDTKIRVKKQHLIKSLPKNLVFVLNRFEYDSTMHQRKKLNDYLEFPFDLNMQRWMVRDYNNDNDEQPKNYDYTLTGVLVHSGVAESGHYYSYIKDGDKWLELNDTTVVQKDTTMVI